MMSKTMSRVMVALVAVLVMVAVAALVVGLQNRAQAERDQIVNFCSDRWSQSADEIDEWLDCIDTVESQRD